MAAITVAEFAAEIGTDPRTARKFLRSITPKDSCPGKGARWAIEKKNLRSLRSKFAAFEKAENDRRTARENAKNAPAENAPENADDALENAEPTDAELAAIEND